MEISKNIRRKLHVKINLKKEWDSFFYILSRLIFYSKPFFNIMCWSITIITVIMKMKKMYINCIHYNIFLWYIFIDNQCAAFRNLKCSVFPNVKRNKLCPFYFPCPNIEYFCYNHIHSSQLYNELYHLFHIMET
jgi:hypothetical protein